MSELTDALSAHLPQEYVQWRAQSVTGDGTKAMALAYIDARAVMDRLDMVAGPENWQDSYTETAKGRIICTLSVRIGGEWIAKSDGAGDTDVEGEKGALSDALKRAAVKWGIGRYLYDMPANWVPCETYEKNGKKHWKRWIADPWASVRSAAHKPPPSNVVAMPERPAPAPPLSPADQKLMQDMLRQETMAALDAWTKRHGGAVKASPASAQFYAAYKEHAAGLRQVATVTAG